MASRHEGATELVEEATAIAAATLEGSRAEQAQRFVRTYYAHVPTRDLRGRTPADLYGAAMAHLAFARRRDAPLVRVYTPDLEQHGWQSTHSVVEVVTDDMPFLVDSLTMELSNRGCGIHLVIHPLIHVHRDEQGRLVDVADAPGAHTAPESFLHAEIDRQGSAAALDEIRARVERTLDDVRKAVSDWQPMQAQVSAVLESLREDPPPVEAEEREETERFLEWLLDDHFTFLGYRTYDLVEQVGDDVLLARLETGLGILRDAPASVKRFAEQPREVRALARSPELLMLTKANTKATVHRRSYLDYVGVKRFGPDGRPCGEWRFLGLYTSSVYSAPPSQIPVVRRKVAAVSERAGFLPHDHATKDLQATLELYPRDELFEIPTDELYDIAMGIVGLQERKEVRLFLRRDRFGRYYSCLVFVPRDRYTTSTRLRLQDVLVEEFAATAIDNAVLLTESVLARVHFRVHVRGDHPGTDVDRFERRLGDVTRTWADDLAEALHEEAGEEHGARLGRRFAEAFPAGYRADHRARVAVVDIRRMEALGEDDLAVSLYRPVDEREDGLRLKLYRSGSAVTLSDVLPRLEHMGVEVTDERPYEITPAGGPSLWIYDFGLRHARFAEVPIEQVQPVFVESFLRVWHGDAEDDGLNRLVLNPGLRWLDVTLLRAYSKYLRQAVTYFSEPYLQSALVGHPHVAALLRGVFAARFDPDGHDAARADALVEEIEAALDDVDSLDEDRILRSFLHVLLATVRTNAFQRTGDGDDPPRHLSLKLDPSTIPGLPRPLPAFEIFVYSPRTEGVHLRAGLVARGGLRWSDRREDFRTEVLGLVKAQNVKNAVIVPVGAKGGFVVKRPPEDRQELSREVQECYRTFIRGLLDVTDGIVGDEVVPPARVVRYDGDDPYLVVAADKGTASFSDTANALAAEYGFWLGDAFAAGGSAGYDHKAMGITARGAWKSVSHHFREMSIDVDEQDFTCAGIGDMSGDVFGNGMLLSEHIRLVAAFDHRHIFLDPDPDAASSHAERGRLFALPRSSWDDYDRELISAGGGVWPRTAKSVPLSEQARGVLDVTEEALSPDELIQAILRAPVNLLFNGGIGTFVKASHESHADVGDKTTDRIRVDASQLRAKVVGEGGNLGFTQHARVEYALAGGRINTDAIDNSAGVDTSDHEVNFKILLGGLVADGELTGKQRNALLEGMTDEVAVLVLRNTDEQNQALSRSCVHAVSMADVLRRYLRHLDEHALLDRALEFMPDDETLVERRHQGQGLVRPEFAVVLASTKMALYDQLLDSDVCEDPWLARALLSYFPRVLRERYPEEIRAHRLSREIIATQVANQVVNEAGTTFLFRLAEETGASSPDIVRAHTVASTVFGLRDLQDAVRALDHEVPALIQTRMVLEGRRLVERGSRWLLRNRSSPLDISACVDFFGPGTTAVTDLLPGPMAGVDRRARDETAAELADAGVPTALAERVANLPVLYAALALVTVADAVDEDVATVTEAYLVLAERLHLDWLGQQIIALPRDTRWQALARDALRDDVHAQHQALTAEALRASDQDTDAVSRVDGWLRHNAAKVRRCERMLAEIQAVTSSDLAVLSVGLREIRNLVEVHG
ncbi:MAG: NAD-glutamate dehydrogenase [Egibacteraceae bacterium]